MVRLKNVRSFPGSESASILLQWVGGWVGGSGWGWGHEHLPIGYRPLLPGSLCNTVAKIPPDLQGKQYVSFNVEEACQMCYFHRTLMLMRTHEPLLRLYMSCSGDTGCFLWHLQSP
jgi:hypothetical protein